MSARNDRPLTHLQAQVLGAIAASRDGIAPADLGVFVRVSASSARSAAVALEHRGLVTAVYTGHGGKGRIYAATQAGLDASSAYFEGDQ